MLNGPDVNEYVFVLLGMFSWLENKHELFATGTNYVVKENLSIESI